jgi:hypothetical protein
VAGELHVEVAVEHELACAALHVSRHGHQVEFSGLRAENGGGSEGEGKQTAERETIHPSDLPERVSQYK